MERDENGMQVDGGIRHATLRLGSSHLELMEAPPDYPVGAGTFYMYVPDCDAAFAGALSAGAQKHSDPADQSYGDRHASVTDLSGNVWYLASKLAGQSSHAG
ncbi:MAG TPA: VOC family protein [Candidatus Limnocylindrales bacterium]|nr:VOC family protein [Candidatus Limnocylindrales bacterium]